MDKPLPPICLPASSQSRALISPASGNHPAATSLPSTVISASDDACSLRITVLPKAAPETVSSPVDAVSSDSPGPVFTLPETGQTEPLGVLSMPEFVFFLNLDHHIQSSPPIRAYDSFPSAKPPKEPPLFVPTDPAKEFLHLLNQPLLREQLS